MTETPDSNKTESKPEVSPSNVTSLFTRESVTPEGQPVAEVLALLETVMSDARAGRVRAIALVVIGSVGDFKLGFNGEGTVTSLVGAVEFLKHAIVSNQPGAGPARR